MSRRGARQAWLVLAGVSVVVVLFGLSDLVGGARDLGAGESVLMGSLTGTSWDQLRSSNAAAAHLVDWKFRSDGATLVALGLLAAAVSAFGFRRGERWAWVALWAVPLWMAMTVAAVIGAIEHPEAGTPVPVVSGSILGIIAAAALIAGRPSSRGFAAGLEVTTSSPDGG